MLFIGPVSLSDRTQVSNTFNAMLLLPNFESRTYLLLQSFVSLALDAKKVSLAENIAPNNTDPSITRTGLLDPSFQLLKSTKSLVPCMHAANVPHCGATCKKPSWLTSRPLQRTTYPATTTKRTRPVPQSDETGFLCTSRHLKCGRPCRNSSCRSHSRPPCRRLRMPRPRPSIPHVTLTRCQNRKIAKCHFWVQSLLWSVPDLDLSRSP